MSSIQPDADRCQVDAREKVAGQLVVACRNRSELLEFLKKVLDQMARFVKFSIVVALSQAVALRRNDRRDAGLLQREKNPRIGIECLVREQGVGLQSGEQRIGARQIRGFSARQMKLGRVAQRIGPGMDFGAQAAFAPPNGLIPGFFWAPALC